MRSGNETTCIIQIIGVSLPLFYNHHFFICFDFFRCINSKLENERIKNELERVKLEKNKEVEMARIEKEQAELEKNKEVEMARLEKERAELEKNKEVEMARLEKE